MIEISAETVERVETLLSGIPKGAERALSNAMNRGLAKVKTGANKRVRQVYAVQSSAINEATRTRIQKASAGNLAGYISFAGFKIPLYKFQVTPKVPGTGKQVKAALQKGSGTPFEDAFIAMMKNGHMGVFERTGEQGIKSRLERAGSKKGSKHTEKIRELPGLSMPQMLGNKDVIAELEAEAQKTVDERVAHEIDRLLNGYGG